MAHSLPTKPDKIKHHNQGQPGYKEHNEDSQEPIFSQERLKAQIAHPYLESNQNNDRSAKEEGIFQDRKEPPTLIGLSDDCHDIITFRELPS